jgi:hypothetical protein
LQEISKWWFVNKVLARGNTINAEFSHVLTDGSGALEFFKTVLILYSGECGAKIPPEYQLGNPVDRISEEEYEDAYNRYFKAEIPPMVKRSKGFSSSLFVKIDSSFYGTQSYCFAGTNKRELHTRKR